MQVVGAVGHAAARIPDHKIGVIACLYTALTRQPVKVRSGCGCRWTKASMPPCPLDTIASNISGKRGSGLACRWRFGESLLEARQITCRTSWRKAHDRKTRDQAPDSNARHSAAWSASSAGAANTSTLPHADATGFLLSETNNADRFPPKLAHLCPRSTPQRDSPRSRDVEQHDLGIHVFRKTAHALHGLNLGQRGARGRVITRGKPALCQPSSPAARNDGIVFRVNTDQRAMARAAAIADRI